MATDPIGTGIPGWLRNSPTYFVTVIDLQGCYVFVNDIFRKRCLCLAENPVGLPASTTVHPDDLEKSRSSFEHCLAFPHETRSVEVRMVAVPTGTRWTSWDFSCLQDQDAKPLGILCVGHDIGEARQALRNARKMDAILENITDGFYVLDRNWRFIKVNVVAEQILGLASGQLVGTCFWDIFPDTPDYAYPAALRQAMHENRTVRFEDFRPDLDKWFEATAYPSSEGITVFFRDTTEKHAAEENLRLYERQLRAIFNSGSEIKAMIAPDHRVMYFNQNALDAVDKLFGSQIVIGTDFMNYVHQADRTAFASYLDRALAGEFVDVETRMELPCHGSAWVWLRFHPVQDQGRIVGVSYNASNITERKRVEEKLLTQNEVLRQINWHQSHAIRRPVANILGLMHLIEEAGVFSNAHTPFFDYLQQATHELDQVISTIVAESNSIL